MIRGFSRAVRNARTAALGMIMVVVATVFATPASAEEQCWHNYVCVWDVEGNIERIYQPAEGTCIPGTVTRPDGTTTGARKVHNVMVGRLMIFSNSDCSGAPADTRGYNSFQGLREGTYSFRRFNCEDGKICFWANQYYSGEKIQRDYADSCASIGIEAWSLYNRSGKGIGLYKGWACVGASWRGDVASGDTVSLSDGVTKISRI